MHRRAFPSTTCHRRAFLTTCCCAPGVATAGCLSGADDPSDDGAPAGDEAVSYPLEREGVVLDDLAVFEAVAYESFLGSGGVFAAEDRQYVVASVRADGDVRTSRFRFVTDEDAWEPGLPDGHGAGIVSVEGRSSGSDGEFLAFSVPSPLDASNPRIEHPLADASWPLPADRRERLAAPGPRFELRSLSVPDEVSQGDALPVTLTVQNVAETDGRFLAAVYWPTYMIDDDDESRVFEHAVVAGETLTLDLEIGTHYTAAEERTIDLRVEGHVTADRSVELVDVEREG